MADTGKILLKHDGPVSTLTLNRPEKLNALDSQMIDTLSAACREVEKRDDTRAVILTGAGTRAFCAGGDIADWSDYGELDFGRHWIRQGHRAFDTIARLRQPVIAVLNGHVLGGGLELAACADLRIGEVQIMIGQPEAGIGIIPGWSGTQRSVRRFGSQTIRRMALFGEMFGAEEACRLGLVDQIAESGKGMEEAARVVERLLTRSPLASELVKLLVNMADGEERESSTEALAGMVAAGSSDLREGVQAFKDGRKPRFPA